MADVALRSNIARDFAREQLRAHNIVNDGFLLTLIAPSRWLAWLRPGTPFKVDIHETDKTYSAKVVRLSGRVDPVSQTIKVIGEITQTAPELMAGMSGRAVIMPPNGQ